MKIVLTCALILLPITVNRYVVERKEPDPFQVAVSTVRVMYAVDAMSRISKLIRDQPNPHTTKTITPP